MALDQRTEFLYEPHGERYPSVVIKATGVHDVGRLIATLARGNCEHISVAYEVGRELNRSEEGRATLRYLESHGGPKLGPLPCEECAEGNHAGCFQRLYPHDPVDGAVCGCFEAAGDFAHVTLEEAS